MTHIPFILELKEVQNLIQKSVKDDLSKNILITLFNQLMEELHTQYN